MSREARHSTGYGTRAPLTVTLLSGHNSVTVRGPTPSIREEDDRERATCALPSVW